MKKAVMMPLITILAAAGLLVVPVQGFAGIQQDLQKQIDQIAKQEAANLKKQQETEKKKSSVRTQMQEVSKDIDEIKADIEKNGKELNKLNLQMTDVNLKLAETVKLLDEAEERVKLRLTLLKSRVKLMYTNGSVSYLEVLLNATSFSDLLERFQNLQTIVAKDKEILEANKKDKDAITQQKEEKEKKLAELQSLHAQSEALKQTLLKQEKQKEVTIAGLKKQDHDLDEISEESEQEALELVRQKQALRNKQLEEQRKEAAEKSGKPVIQKPAYAGGKLVWPIPSGGVITSEFGYRVDPIKKVNRLHKGLDIGAPKGTTIVAADSGTVILAGWVSGYGNTVVVDHDNGLVTWYAHMSAISVSEGDTVKRGGKIGAVGSTGDSTGNHLHFEVHTDSGPTNPRSYLGL